MIQKMNDHQPIELGCFCCGAETQVARKVKLRLGRCRQL